MLSYLLRFPSAPQGAVAMVLAFLMASCAAPRIVDLNSRDSQSSLVCAKVQGRGKTLLDAVLGAGEPVKFVYAIQGAESDLELKQPKVNRPAELAAEEIPLLASPPEFFCTPNAPAGWHAYVLAFNEEPQFIGPMLFDRQSVAASKVQVPPGTIVYAGTMTVRRQYGVPADDLQEHYRSVILEALKARGASSFNIAVVGVSNAPGGRLSVAKPTKPELERFTALLERAFRPAGWGEQIDRFKSANP